MKRLSLLLILSLSLLYAQDVELNRINALDEFKWGVKFYNQGFYEKSVFSFERSLSFDSMDLRTHQWLGNAYFMKGDVEAALEEWNLLSERDQIPLWLESKIEIILSKRGVLDKLYEGGEWVSLFSKKISRPISVFSMPNGNSAVVSFMENMIHVFNINGAEIQRFNGGIEPFDRPFDIISDDNGGFIVTEFMSNKITFINSLGLKVKSINHEKSPIIGPGYLAKSEDGYFYVSDWGNRRVCKFDMDGNYILSITHKNLKRPSGILVKNDDIYIADSLGKSLLLFDKSGNFIKTVISDGLESPEGLSLKSEDTIFIADSTTLKEYNIKKGQLRTVSDLQGKGSKITKAVTDVNGNTITTDFNLGEFHSLTDITTLYSGMSLNIDRIITDNFPEVSIEVQVNDMFFNPVIGMDNSNFLISEAGRVVESRNVVYKGNDNSDINLSLILDLDLSMKGFNEIFYEVGTTIENELQPSDRVSLIKAADKPEIGIISGSEFLSAIGKISDSSFIERTGIDESIKLAASTLIPSWSKREIVLVTNGLSKDSDFLTYSLNEIKDFLVNNRISLTVLYLNEDRNEELEYLVKHSMGSSRSLFKGRGTIGIVSDLRTKKSGFYVIKYTSGKSIDNGEVYTPVEVELNYIRKSGRVESGFYIPLKVVE